MYIVLAGIVDLRFIFVVYKFEDKLDFSRGDCEGSRLISNQCILHSARVVISNLLTRQYQSASFYIVQLCCEVGSSVLEVGDCYLSA